MTANSIYTIKQKLPSLYHSFFPDWINWEIPNEKWATCSDCILQKMESTPFMGTKCCTYYPDLMNYLVGGILKDENPMLEEGKKQIKEIIKKRLGVTPFGLLAPVKYLTRKKEIYRKEKLAMQSGMEQYMTSEMANSLKCPYYRDGFCSVWAYREHCCSTFFCVSVASRTGKNFWSALDTYLIQVENKLSKYIVEQSGLFPGVIPKERINSIGFGLEEENGKIDHDTYKRLWGEWYGREEKWYVHSYELISQLTTDEFKRIQGKDNDNLEKSLHEQRELFLNPPVPETLQLNPEIIISESGTNGYISLHNLKENKKFSVPAFILSILQQFDGHKSTETILKSNGQLGKFYKTDFLIPLYQKGILQEKIDPKAI